MLLDALQDPNRHARSLLLPLTLIRRQSTGPPSRALA
jgi:hypothetical protein